MTNSASIFKTIRLALAFALAVGTFTIVASVSSDAKAAPVDCSRGVNLSFEGPRDRRRLDDRSGTGLVHN